jgi:aspartyl-tRNA(Asn)/glutamyl-tRNA(Gln) amidotransferase subunit B
MYQPTIGLEIHAELKTKTKMFCSCLNDPLEKHSNINICPICLGHPGTLPTINKKAVEAVLKLGLALNSEIPETSKFDRKNYFYPDLPKGYQISQYDAPLCVGGYLEISDAEDDDALVQSKIKNQKSKIQIKNKKIKLRRIHLEEDTARLVHATSDKGQATSLVDFNRAGVPLMELVTEPDIKSGKEAVAFARELQLILRYLGISDADMEKGQLRIEANVSLRPEIPNSKSQIPNKSQIQNSKLGTKVEIKNLNSFRAVEEAIDYEIKRQSEILEKGEAVRHETRGWDEFEKKTKSQRIKEEAHDYRYFPEPDLPVISLREIADKRGTNAEQRGGFIDLERLKIEIPELPVQKRLRFAKEYNLTPNQAEILTEDRILAQYFEEAASELKSESPLADYHLLFNYLISDLKGLMAEQKISVKELNITPENFADLIVLLGKGELSSRLAKDILKEMFLSGRDPGQIIKEKGLKQISDEEIIKKTIEEIIAENLKAVEDYKKGKETALHFLIGKTMAKLKGQGKPEIIEKLLKETLTNLF